jgi:hypothetical protein
MDQFLRGFITAGTLVIALFFLRFYIRGHDRLFLFFSLSFFLLALNRIALALVAHHDIDTSIPYLVRAFAYLLILLVIIDKNFFNGRKPPS